MTKNKDYEFIINLKDKELQKLKNDNIKLKLEIQKLKTKLKNNFDLGYKEGYNNKIKNG